MNKVIKLLMLSDLFIFVGFGLIDPILAIFINDNIVGGTIFAAGIASMLFLLTKSVVQLPFSKYVDRTGDRRTWLIIGTLLIAIVPFLYIFAKDINMIYFAQVFHGIGSGLAYPTWTSLWSINLDRKQESFEWSLFSTATGIGSAIAAVIGAAIAEFVGFAVTFVFVGIISLAGCGILFALDNDATKRAKRARKGRKTGKRAVETEPMESY